MDRNSRIFVAGHRGLVGSAILRRLTEAGHTDLVIRDRSQLDLTDQAAVRAFFDREGIDQVILAAAKVGGILANDRFGGDFIRDNLLIQSNVIDAAWRAGVKKLLFLGSSCLYPKHAEQPIKEEALLSGPMEPSNKPYAVAKIAGITMCQAYRRQYGFNAICAMPSNLYGPGDHFEPETSHALPGMIRRFHDAKLAGDPTVTLWGTGTLTHDLSKPDGHPRKLMDVSRLFATGWRPKVSLEEGLRRTYGWFLENAAPDRHPAPKQAAE